MEEAVNNAESKQQKQWLAVYTKPRWEKKLQTVLQEAGLECWCPMQVTERKWSDRKKKIAEPLFKGYLFVHVTTPQRTEVRKVPGILNFVYYLGKPAIIRSEEIDTIKRFIESDNATITVVSKESFEKDTQIRVVKGVFMNQQGKVIKALNSRRVMVALETLGQVMVVEFGVNQLETA
ncbi:MAG: UpxY family transcription antiterminator [Bacteroidetes bacterium]|jgi:transcription antitermination factor NusG|nr:MAG: UpxY family transcription antiterminator [Bacteroidota bacterium]TAE67215.1 MAG: UpxY family transcription antiterminator [Bacteroidota bacterium]